MKFKVEDMTCGHCRKAIEAAVTAAGGSASVDLDARTVEVAGLDTARAAEVIAAEGYTPVPLD